MSSRTTTIVLLCLLSACGREPSPRASSRPEPANVPGAAPTGAARLERKITRTAELDLECEEPEHAQTEAMAIAERLGGYVGTSDVAHGGHEDEPELVLRMTLRIPSDRLTAALVKLKALATRVSSERVNAEDVTEEFIDLNARISAEAALERQFVDILKQARTVNDALAVHAQLAQVRTDLEKLEGRKQFLDSQAALSTIRLSASRRPAVLATSWFGGVRVTLGRAARDAVATTTAILHGTIRFLGFAAPVFGLLVLPTAWLTRLWKTKFRGTRQLRQSVD